ESYHRLSPISPFINVHAGIITAGVTTLALSLIFLPAPASALAGWIIAALLRLMLTILDLALRIHGDTFRVPSPPKWVWVVHSISAGSLFLAIRKKSTVLCCGSMAAVLALHALIAFKDFSPRPPGSVTLTFLDV